MSEPNSDDTLEVQAMLRRGRLAIDVCEPGRTTFLTHVGATAKLVPGAWIAHRDLLRAMALANLHPQQRASLARAVLVDYGHEFGVGRLRLEARPSGLPLGGSAVWMESRTSGASCLYTWAVGTKADPRACDWLVLRAEPSWALDRPPKPISAVGLSTLAELAGHVLVLVSTAVDARVVADLLAGVLPVSAHPRFHPYLEESSNEAKVVLWPYDGLGSSAFTRYTFGTVVPIAAREHELQAVEQWAATQASLEVASASEPGRLDRKGLERFWQACGKPKILLRGDPRWTAPGSAWLRSRGAEVHGEATSTQLGLF